MDTWQRSNSIVVSDTELRGDADARPVLGSILCSSGRHRWRLSIESDNRLYIGVGLHNAQPSHMESNSSTWCFRIRDKYIFAAGSESTRDDPGPSEFKVPVEVQVQLDCDEGNLSATIGDIELGVVHTALPRGQPMCLAVGTNDPNCVVVLLEYAALAKTVVTCYAQIDAEDRMLVDCIGCTGEELAKITVETNGNVEGLRTALSEAINIPSINLTLLHSEGHILTDTEPARMLL